MFRNQYLVENMSSKYEKLERIGKGTYGIVYRAKTKVGGKIVALKETIFEETDEPGIPSVFLREIALLHKLSNNPHIVKLLDVEHIQTNDGRPKLYLIFDYYKTDLYGYIENFSREGRMIPLAIIKSFMFQLLKGVAYCHSHGVMHRDLKPLNLLVDEAKGVLKIGDLGLGRAFTVPLRVYSHEVMSLIYRAPEVLLGLNEQYSCSVDMWSLGCIFAELYNQKHLFLGDSELQQILHIFYAMGTPNEDVWPGVTSLYGWHVYPQWRPQKLSKLVPNMDPDALHLLSMMMQYDPSKRISAREALNHPYFVDVNISHIEETDLEASNMGQPPIQS